MNSLSDAHDAIHISSVEAKAPLGMAQKRVVDVILALSGIVLLAPLLIICYLATVLTSAGPAIFRHRRVGFNGHHFECFKFRTMVTDSSERLRQLLESDPAAAAEWAATRKLRHDPRVTAIGAILRKSSLDELPQLFNVLRGEMSLVGPRPPIASEVEKYELEHFRRLEVLPGLTGLWQVQARQDSSFAKYIALDTAYVENWSFWLDLKILMRTAEVVLRGTGT